MRYLLFFHFNTFCRSLQVFDVSNSARQKRRFSQKRTGKTTCPMWCPQSDLNRYDLLGRGILSPLRLPIPPCGHIQIVQLRSLAASQLCLEAPPRLGLGVELLQSSALPLGYGAVNLYYSIKQTKKMQPFKRNLYEIMFRWRNFPALGE